MGQKWFGLRIRSVRRKGFWRKTENPNSRGPQNACEPLHACGDVNASGQVSAADALLLLKQSVGQNQTLVCGCSDGNGLCESALATCTSELSSANADIATCNEDRTACGNETETCEAGLAGCNGELESCEGEADTCRSGLGSCEADLSAVTGDLGICETDCSAAVRPTLRTGQTRCYSGSDVADCEATGQDGEFQNGAIRNFTDNGDGTITDNATLLVWEKLSDDDGIHDKDATYTWADAFAVKVATLNSEKFAGYDDWRVPNVHEMQSIWNRGTHAPAIFSPFHDQCEEGCTVSTCSCVVDGFSCYSTSSTYLANERNAWCLSFEDSGGLSIRDKTEEQLVRAVRGGA